MTTVIAWLALAVSLISLGWQVLSWVRSGARLIVNSLVHIPLRHHAISGKQVHPGLLYPDQRAIQEFRTGKRDPDSYLMVVVTNSGRLATTVQDVELRVDFPRGVLGGVDMHEVEVATRIWDGPKFPVRLEPGDQIAVFFSMNLIEATLHRYGMDIGHVAPRVRSGHGVIDGERFRLGFFARLLDRR